MENPERHEITKQFNLLKNTVKSEDVLLIYYAGHGFLDQKTDEGYWLPADAEEEDDSFWISNNYVINKLKAINAKNILLVSDSCFSGSLITRGIKKNSEIKTLNMIEKFLNTQSRVTISSGGLKPVLDSGGGKNSIFARSFIDALTSIRQPTTSAELYLQLRNNVTQKSLSLGIEQIPLRGEVIDAGHLAPDFVFLPTILVFLMNTV